MSTFKSINEIQEMIDGGQLRGIDQQLLNHIKQLTVDVEKLKEAKGMFPPESEQAIKWNAWMLDLIARGKTVASKVSNEHAQVILDLVRELDNERCVMTHKANLFAVKHDSKQLRDQLQRLHDETHAYLGIDRFRIEQNPVRKQLHSSRNLLAGVEKGEANSVPLNKLADYYAMEAQLQASKHLSESRRKILNHLHTYLQTELPVWLSSELLHQVYVLAQESTPQPPDAESSLSNSLQDRVAKALVLLNSHCDHHSGDCPCGACASKTILSGDEKEGVV